MIKNRFAILTVAGLVAASVVVLSGCASGGTKPAETSKPASGFTVSTTAAKGSPEVGFDSGLTSIGRLDTIYGAKPGDPANSRLFPFSWKGQPAGTKAIAVILDDPDAKPILASRGVTADFFLHWIATDIDPALGGLPDDGATNATFTQGKNGAGQVGYRAPTPPGDFPKDAPKGRVHIYRLKVLALSAPTGLAAGFSLDDLLAAVKDKTLATAQINLAYSN